jgi:metal-responsive CopG/Arc/MetJ family transcriptional regulator
MGARTKVTVSVDAELIKELGIVSRRTGTARSRLVEEALRLWRRQQLDEALQEGYRAMAREDRATARRYRRAVREALR